MRFGAALLFCLISTTASAQQFATVTTNAPIYAAAQETPTPLRVAAVGSRLRVLSTERRLGSGRVQRPAVGQARWLGAAPLRQPDVPRSAADGPLGA